jgi:RNA polymerase sigma-70 factor (ECF subfamily)
MGTSNGRPVSNRPDEQEFLTRTAQLVYNLALRLTGNASDAEDLAQDSLLRALKALSGFRGESDSKTWAYRITVNTWKNRVRAEKRRGFWRTVSLGLFCGEEGDEEPPFKADDPPLDRGLEKTEAQAEVRTALRELDPEDRAVIILREVQEQSYAEIAEVLGVPEGTVKSRLFRAREALRARFIKKTGTQQP